MKCIKAILTSIFGVLTSLFMFLFKDIDANLKYLIIVVILDFISGIFKAFIQRKINSSVGIKGVFKKFCYFIVVAISIIVGNIINIGDTLKEIVTYSLIFNEIISILENCAEMGIKLPNALISSLEIFNSKIEKYDDEELKEKSKD